MRHICFARACLPQNATHMYRTMHAPCCSRAVRVMCLARLLSGCVVVAYYNRACAVQMYKALSVRCFTKKKKKITLRCVVIGTCAVQFLHYIPLFRNTQYYATLNCSVKASLRAGGT